MPWSLGQSYFTKSPISGGKFRNNNDSTKTGEMARQDASDHADGITCLGLEVPNETASFALIASWQA